MDDLKHEIQAREGHRKLIKQPTTEVFIVIICLINIINKYPLLSPLNAEASDLIKYKLVKLSFIA